ncbi:hypothetical protein IKF12_02565 [Candidatus Saccharibacteria bacterium]|nr:hypothetical protein [Candidatus Saccharibacteria bacterium]
MSTGEELPKNDEAGGNTGWENMEYKKVNTKEYVEAGLADGSLEVFEAVKHARIAAMKGEVGQEVISWSEDENGNPIQEKVATVDADEETGETGWIATKTDAEGNPIIDRNGHTNQWIISDKTFRKKYEVDPEHPDIFKPVGGPQKFVETREGLVITQWGEEMKMPRGSFINITNPDDMYAVNPRDFNDTYTKTKQEGVTEKIVALKQEIKEGAPGMAAFYYKNVRDTELDFAKRSKAINDGGGKMSEKEFLEWEDGLEIDLRQAEHEERLGKLSFSQATEARQHMVAYYVDTELHKTIEAQAGNYYDERDRALRQAIKDSGKPESEEDLMYLNSFYPAVAHHLEYKYMTPSTIRDYGADRYERERTRAHNDAIRRLNGINDLARKYRTRPFTARNFATSDLVNKNAQSLATQRVMRYDRDIVEEYYAIAFSYEVRDIKAKFEHESKFDY